MNAVPSVRRLRCHGPIERVLKLRTFKFQRCARHYVVAYDTVYPHRVVHLFRPTLALISSFRAHNKLDIIQVVPTTQHLVQRARRAVPLPSINVQGTCLRYKHNIRLFVGHLQGVEKGTQTWCGTRGCNMQIHSNVGGFRASGAIKKPICRAK